MNLIYLVLNTNYSLAHTHMHKYICLLYVRSHSVYGEPSTHKHTDKCTQTRHIYT